MIEIRAEDWWAVVLLMFGALALVVVMFAYVVRVSRSAYLGDLWIGAAGSYRRAAFALRDFRHETEALVVLHTCRFPPGTVVRIDRESVERLIAAHPDHGGGPGL